MRVILSDDIIKGFAELYCSLMEYGLFIFGVTGTDGCWHVWVLVVVFGRMVHEYWVEFQYNVMFNGDPSDGFSVFASMENEVIWLLSSVVGWNCKLRNISDKRCQ